jgi:hypothetical protein
LLTRATESGTGAWQEKRGAPIENNPVDVVRPQIALSQGKGSRAPTPEANAALDMAVHVRGLNDFQIGSPATYWDRRANSGLAKDVTIDLGRQTTAAEAKALFELGDKHGLTFANTGEGAGFLNFNEKHTGVDTRDLLKKGGLAAEIKKIVPDAKVGRAAATKDIYADYGGKISEANQGQGLGTRYLDEQLQSRRGAAERAYQGLLDDPNEAAKSQQTLRVLRDSGQAGVRPDYELWHRLIAEGRLRQALEWARANQYRGLPAAAGGAGLSAGLLGADNSTGGGS